MMNDLCACAIRNMYIRKMPRTSRNAAPLTSPFRLFINTRWGLGAAAPNAHIRRFVLLCAFVVLAPLTVAAQTLEPSELDARLFVFALAYDLQKKCDHARPRFFAAIGFMNKTYDLAGKHGISKAALDAYVDDPTAQAVMQTRVDAYVAGRTHCAVAQVEIRDRTPSGKLLRMK